MRKMKRGEKRERERHTCIDRTSEKGKEKQKSSKMYVVKDHAVDCVIRNGKDRVKFSKERRAMKRQEVVDRAMN